jgi:putative glutamine amidotransferase
MAAQEEGRMARPLIGITGYLEPARWSDFVREAVISPVTYCRAVERAGGIPVVLPPVPIDSVPRLVAGLDGLLISCGPDLDPRLYGAMRHESTSPPDRRRDTFDLALVRAAIDAERPFLGVCRGMHVINVVRGGTLLQHLPDAVGHDRHAPDPVKLSAHPVQVSVSSKLGQIIGPHASVPTRHHQGVQRLGSGLLAVAWADDQIVEAVELQGHPFGLGVQWHPEEEDDLRIFGQLVAAAAATRLSPPRPRVPRQGRRLT